MQKVVNGKAIRRADGKILNPKDGKIPRPNSHEKWRVKRVKAGLTVEEWGIGSPYSIRIALRESMRHDSAVRDSVSLSFWHTRKHNAAVQRFFNPVTRAIRKKSTTSKEMVLFA